MQTRKPLFDRLFLVISVLASLFVITELVMNSLGKSLCVSEGCALTAQAARYGDISIFLLGLGAFITLAALAIVNLLARKPGIDRLINFILVIALTGEGFFMGYLAFRLHTACLFCLIICCFMVTLGLLRLLAGEKDALTGFAAFAVMFVIQYLILPAGVPVHLPANERLVLFYSKDCKHCAEIIKEFDDRKIHVAHEPVNGYAGFLKNMGIEHVPTLMVNDPYQKVFLTGKDAIMRYLLSCTEAKQAEPKKKASKKSVVHAKGNDLMIDLFNQPTLLTAPSLTPADAGMCKEEEICK